MNCPACGKRIRWWQPTTRVHGRVHHVRCTYYSGIR